MAPKWPPLRQTFLGEGLVSGRYKFVLDCNSGADYLLTVADGHVPKVNYEIPRRRRIVLLMENPSIWTPSLQYLEYFGVVLSPSQIPVPEGTRLLLSQPAVSWFYGLKFRTDKGLSHEPVLENFLQLDDLAVMSMPEKKKLFSCVVSGKTLTNGHKWRVEVATALKKYFGDAIDIYGFGWNPISDKREAIDPYLYTIVIENDSKDNYWTEKLSDAILGYSQPIYAGASNVGEYFEHKFPCVDYGVNTDEFVARVKMIVESSPFAIALYERRLQVMYCHNMFYHIAKLIEVGAV